MSGKPEVGPYGTVCMYQLGEGFKAVLWPVTGVIYQNKKITKKITLNWCLESWFRISNFESEVR